jgi:hypothetical protein
MAHNIPVPAFHHFQILILHRIIENPGDKTVDEWRMDSMAFLMTGKEFID